MDEVLERNCPACASSWAEAAVLESLRERGEADVLDVSWNTYLPRVTIEDILTDLEQRGLVSRRQADGVIAFVWRGACARCNVGLAPPNGPGVIVGRTVICRGCAGLPLHPAVAREDSGPAQGF